MRRKSSKYERRTRQRETHRWPSRVVSTGERLFGKGAAFYFSYRDSRKIMVDNGSTLLLIEDDQLYRRAAYRSQGAENLRAASLDLNNQPSGAGEREL
jgi:hypothetical protein